MSAPSRRLGSRRFSPQRGPAADRVTTSDLCQVPLRMKESRCMKQVHKELILYLLKMLTECLQDARHCATVWTKGDNRSCPYSFGAYSPVGTESSDQGNPMTSQP